MMNIAIIVGIAVTVCVTIICMSVLIIVLATRILKADRERKIVDLIVKEEFPAGRMLASMAKDDTVAKINKQFKEETKQNKPAIKQHVITQRG